MRPIITIRTAIAAMVLASAAAPCQETDPPRSLKYSYAAVLGSGVYFLEDRTLLVLRVPFKKTLKEPQVGKWGSRLLMPVTFGYKQYDEELYPDAPDSLASLSFVPGIELEYKPNADWAIKPFAHIGIGVDLDSRARDAIWALGIRTRGDIRHATPLMTFGAELLYASNEPEVEDFSDSFTRLGIGLDFRFPLKMTIGSRSTSFNTHLVGYEYVRDVDFAPEVGEFYESGTTVEVGLALGLDPPLRLMGFSLDRVGLGFRYGSHQKSIILVRKFPF